MRRLLAVIFTLFYVGTNAQIGEVRRITERLCSSEFHGRGYVNKGDSIAAAFLVDEFRKLGVEPFKKSYYQPFSLNVNTFPGKMSVAQNGHEFIAGRDYVIDPSSQGTAHSRLYVKEVPRDKVLDIAYIKTCIDEVLAEGNLHNTLLFDYTKIQGDTLKELRGFVSEIAAIVPVIELINTKFTWSVGREQQYKLYLQIQDSVFDKSAYTDVSIDAKLIKDYQTQNVIAYLPAKKKCTKTLVFTAHYDHLGQMGTNAFFPGANDNASGTAMLLTMASYFKKNPAESNILFIAFAGEEAGLVGSNYFVEHPLIKLEKIDFLVNLDIMGSGEEGITVVNATLHEDEFKMLQDINSNLNLLAKIKSRGPAANSDHYWFTEKGVPAFFIYTMGPNKHYHDIFDTYEELSFNEYSDITTLLIEFVKRLNQK